MAISTIEAKVIDVCTSGGHITIEYTDGSREIMSTAELLTAQDLVNEKNSARQVITQTMKTAVSTARNVQEAAIEIRKLIPVKLIEDIAGDIL